MEEHIGELLEPEGESSIRQPEYKVARRRNRRDTAIQLGPSTKDIEENEKMSSQGRDMKEEQQPKPRVKDKQPISIPEIYKAAIKGNIEPFKHLDDKTHDIEHATSPQKNTVLHVAASLGHEEIVRLICERYPSLLLEQNTHLDTPLHMAARQGHLSVVRFLIGTGNADSNTKNDVEKGGDVKVRQQELLKQRNIDRDTALHEAVKNRHKKVIEVLVKADPSLSYATNLFGDTPIYLAAAAGLVDIVRDMFPLPSDFYDFCIPHGKTPLHAAIIGRHAALVELMVEKAPDLVSVEDLTGKRPLHYAAFLGFFQAVPYLLEKDTSTAYKADKDSLFPIHIAAIKGHVKFIENLLEKCQDSIELRNGDLQNFLHVAAKYGKQNVVKFVLNTHGLENLINEKDRDKNTPLHLATRNWHPKIVSILTRDERVDKSLINEEGMTAFDIAENTKTSLWFQKKLTITALKVADAPRAQYQNVFDGSFQQRYMKVGSTTKNVSNLEFFKDRVNTLLLVATLIATMSFTAGFTIPGGLNSGDPNPGIAILLSKKLFQTFVICNSIAMYSSIMVVVTLIWAQLGEVNLIMFSFKLVMPLLVLSLMSISVAFTAGVSLVVTKLSWLAIVVYVLGLIFIICSLVLFVPLCVSYDSKHPLVRYISYWVFCLLLFVTKIDSGNND